MFAEAVEIARQFTQPVIVSHVDEGGKCQSSIGAFVVVNDEGWCLTSAHIMDHIEKLGTAKKSRPKLQAEIDRIMADKGLSANARKKKTRALIAKAGKQVVDFSVWWGQNGRKAIGGKGLVVADLAVVKIDPPPTCARYPAFAGSTAVVRSGTSVCRLGYPFHKVEPTYEEGKGFLIPGEAVPPPLFPLEGIITRQVLVKGPENTKGYLVAFLETSSPGLRGQSGGPIFDREGVVWAIQSQSRHFPLGFTPDVTVNGKKQVEHQFLSVGWGTHPHTVAGFLSEQGIRFANTGNEGGSSRPQGGQEDGNG